MLLDMLLFMLYSELEATQILIIYKLCIRIYIAIDKLNTLCKYIYIIAYTTFPVSLLYITKK